MRQGGTMKKWGVVVLSICLVFGSVSLSFGAPEAEEIPTWKTVLSDAIKFGGVSDSMMMQEALQFAMTNDVSLSEFLSEVNTINPEAVQVALTSGFKVVDDKSAVIAAASTVNADVGTVVTAAIAADVPAADIVQRPSRQIPHRQERPLQQPLPPMHPLPRS